MAGDEVFKEPPVPQVGRQSKTITQPIFQGSGKGPAWFPPPDPPPGRVTLEDGDGSIKVNGKWYAPVAPDHRPVEVRVFNVGIAIIRLAAVGTVTGAIVVCIVSVLFHVFGLR